MTKIRDFEKLYSDISNTNDLIGLTRKEAITQYSIKEEELEAFSQIMEYAELNECDKCEIIDRTQHLFWIDVMEEEEFTEKNCNMKKVKRFLKKGFSAVCEDCFQELIDKKETKQEVIQWEEE